MGMNKKIFLIPIWIFSLFLMVLLVANRHSVAVYLTPFPYELELPLYLVLFFGLFVGLALGWFVFLLRRMRAAIDLHAQKRENAKLMSKIHDLEKIIDDGNANTAETKQIS